MPVVIIKIIVVILTDIQRATTVLQILSSATDVLFALIA